MRYLIFISAVLFVGCGRGSETAAPPTIPATKRVEVKPVETPPTKPVKDDGFTSAADLVKWKDDPASFVGKKLKVRTRYINPFPNRPDQHINANKSGAPFEKLVEHNGKKIRIGFSVDFSAIEKLPNAYPGEEFDIEFEVAQHPDSKIVFVNRAVSISR